MSNKSKFDELLIILKYTFDEMPTTRLKRFDISFLCLLTDFHKILHEGGDLSYLFYVNFFCLLIRTSSTFFQPF